MAHYRKPLAAAVALNTGIFVVEAIAGVQAHSIAVAAADKHYSLGLRKDEEAEWKLNAV
mgnify:CR=1 FL=1